MDGADGAPRPAENAPDGFLLVVQDGKASTVGFIDGMASGGARLVTLDAAVRVGRGLFLPLNPTYPRPWRVGGVGMVTDFAEEGPSVGCINIEDATQHPSSLADCAAPWTRQISPVVVAIPPFRPEFPMEVASDEERRTGASVSA